MRRAARRDISEKDIIDALLRLGWSVQRVNAKDDPDLVIGKNGRTYHAEVKTGNAKLRPGQVRFAADWRGHRVLVLRNVDDVLELRTS